MTRRPAQGDVRCGQSRLLRERAHPNTHPRFGVYLYAIGLSTMETSGIFGLLGVDHSHVAVWQWTHRLADSEQDLPVRVVVDETAVKIDSER